MYNFTLGLLVRYSLQVYEEQGLINKMTRSSLLLVSFDISYFKKCKIL